MPVTQYAVQNVNSLEMLSDWTTTPSEATDWAVECESHETQPEVRIVTRELVQITQIAGVKPGDIMLKRLPGQQEFTELGRVVEITQNSKGRTSAVTDRAIPEFGNRYTQRAFSAFRLFRVVR